MSSESREVADRLLTALAKIGLAIRSEAWKERERYGLTPTQQQLLVFLNARGPLRVSEVASLLGVTAPTVSDAVGVLVAKGLVERSRDPDDRRIVRLYLTQEGRAQALALAEWPDAFLEAIEVLSEPERGTLLRALSKVIRLLQERGKIHPARMCLTCQYFRPHVYQDPKRPHHCAFVDAPFGDAELRIECPDHLQAEGPLVEENWRGFLSPSVSGSKGPVQGARG
ncbi:MAG: MarR family transcriptional regulator [Candidatus Poribacteria bacterium]|nr:MAG: MarR family transcriptional regulator [Candidatus Poribacteria bacterium]